MPAERRHCRYRSVRWAASQSELLSGIRTIKSWRPTLGAARAIRFLNNSGWPTSSGRRPPTSWAPGTTRPTPHDERTQGAAGGATTWSTRTPARPALGAGHPSYQPLAGAPVARTAARRSAPTCGVRRPGDVEGAKRRMGSQGQPAFRRGWGTFGGRRLLCPQEGNPPPPPLRRVGGWPTTLIWAPLDEVDVDPAWSPDRRRS